MSECAVDDLLIVGGGPAGLSAAINAASEGLTVRVLDAAPIFGGQARESNAIENYLGFPDGVTGEALMSAAVVQARKFGNIVFTCPAQCIDIARNEDGTVTVSTEDYQEYTARAVLLSNGLSYRRLSADNIGAVMGRGVFYGAPMSAMPLNTRCNVAVVGGANSAGQAAVKLASNSKAKVTMFIRKKLDTQMSHYLVSRIRKTPNIRVCEGCEVTAVQGKNHLERLTYRDADGKVHEEDMHYMFIFIGAMPRTSWLRNRIQLDKENYIMTGPTTVAHGPEQPTRSVFHYETSMPGVFAAGDVRAFSTKRIAAAIGEGSAVIGVIHQFLAGLK